MDHIRTHFNMKLEIWTHWTLTVTIDHKTSEHPIHAMVGKTPVLYQLEEDMFARTAYRIIFKGKQVTLEILLSKLQLKQLAGASLVGSEIKLALSNIVGLPAAVLSSADFALDFHPHCTTVHPFHDKMCSIIQQRQCTLHLPTTRT